MIFLCSRLDILITLADLSSCNEYTFIAILKQISISANAFRSMPDSKDFPVSRSALRRSRQLQLLKRARIHQNVMPNIEIGKGYLRTRTHYFYYVLNLRLILIFLYNLEGLHLNLLVHPLNEKS